MRPSSESRQIVEVCFFKLLLFLQLRRSGLGPGFKVSEVPPSFYYLPFFSLSISDAQAKSPKNNKP